MRYNTKKRSKKRQFGVGVEGLEQRQMFAADAFHYEDIQGDSQNLNPAEVFQAKDAVEQSFSKFTLGNFSSFGLGEVAGPPTSVFPASVNATQALTLNNINAHYQYGGLANQDVVSVSFDWVDRGGEENFDLNGLNRYEGELLSMPSAYPGFDVQVSLLGDFDANGVLGTSDVDQLSTKIANGGGGPIHDLNRDAVVDSQDVDAFLDLAGSLRGDANLDRRVDFTDFLVVSQNFGGAGTWSAGDFNEDGMVNFPDFLTLSQKFSEMGDGPVTVGRVEVTAQPGNRIETLEVGGQEFAIDNVTKHTEDREQHVDLVVADLVTPVEAHTGELVGDRIEVYIRNEGTATIPAGTDVPIGLYLSADETITTGDLLLTGGREFLPQNLAPGAVTSISIAPAMSIPNNPALGQQYIGALVDEFDAVAESNETNNSLANRITILGNEPGSVDLVVADVVSPVSATVGEVIGDRLEVYIRNDGTADLPAGTEVSLGLYLSADENITTDDMLLIGGREFLTTGLGAGETTTVTLTPRMTIPANADLGQQYLGVIVDEFDAQSESNEDNNSLASAISIRPETILVPLDPFEDLEPIEPFQPIDPLELIEAVEAVFAM